MARPADIEMKGSEGTTSVQLAGNATSCCCSLWKYTRSSPQAFLYSTSSNRRPRQGWNGWMTSNICVATSLDGAVLNADQRAGGADPRGASGSPNQETAAEEDRPLRSGEPVSRTSVFAGSQPPLCPGGGAVGGLSRA